MTVEDYLALPYHIWMIRDDTGGDAAWVVGVEELPGCLSQGDSPEDAARMIQEAMALWLRAALEDGAEIPRPRPESSFSGRFQVRLPAGLHAALDAEARHQGSSLNALVTTLLAGAVGWSTTSPAHPRAAKSEREVIDAIRQLVGSSSQADERAPGQPVPMSRGA